MALRSLISSGSRAVPLHRGGEESIGDEVEVRSLCTAVLVLLPGVIPFQHLKGVDAHRCQLPVQHSEEIVVPGNNYIFQSNAL